MEVIGNIAGFGIGDTAREMVRGAAITLGGEKVAVQKSDLRTATETVGQSAAALKTSAEAEELRQRTAYLEIAPNHGLVKTQELLMDMCMSGFKPPKP